MMWTRDTVREWIKTGIGTPPPVSGGKGDQTVKNAESDAASFSKTLQSAFATQFGAQKGVLDFLNNKLEASVNNPQGMSPEALAAARTNATQQSATDYNDATRAVQGQIAARGGSTLPSGVNAQIEGGLAQAGANEQSSAQNNITLQNEQLRQQNYWNAVNGLSTTAQIENPNGFAGSANGSTGNIAGLSSALQQSKKGILTTLAGGLASGLGQGLGAFATGGLSEATGWGYKPGDSGG